MTLIDPEPKDLREELHGRILRQAALLRRLQLSLGRDLAEMHRSCSFLLHESTSFPLYCESFGLAGVEGLQLEAVAHGVERAPGLGELVADGTTSIPAAASLARLLGEPALRHSVSLSAIRAASLFANRSARRSSSWRSRKSSATISMACPSARMRPALRLVSSRARRRMVAPLVEM